MENLEHQAAALFGKKEYEQALEIYTILRQGNPKDEKYLIACGNCYDGLGDKDKAIECYYEAIKYHKDSEAALLNLSTIFYELKDYRQAADYAEQVLKINTHNVSAWQNLANVSFCTADYDTALQYYQKMYEYNNNSYIAMINIANTYYSMGKYVLALEFANKSLKKHPSSSSAHILAGNALSAMGKYEKAITMYMQVYEQDPHRTEILNSLSDAYRAINDWENCLLFGWRYIKNNAEHPAAMQLNFGYLLYECYSEKSEELAQKFAAKWLKFFPQNKIVQHMASAIIDGRSLQNSDAEFIKATFNVFAPDFEQTLAELDYQAPSLIFTTLSHHLKHFLWNKYHIIDLGCGTGLCGIKIKKFATFKGLIGVDLSEKMIEEAAKKKVYSQLVCDDICHYLENTPYLFEIAVAADVWTYFGDLTKAFVRVSRALMPDGLFVFTFSENSLNEHDYFLTSSGRFVHTAEYVEKVLKNTGLRLLSMEKQILRNEAEKPVYGYIVAAQKPNLSKQPIHPANGEN
ncbi:MAG: tetratricopeptide repeat protein [Alphaproteobacteria bacterium]|nr:tetratricopeptide repeat protein [Alphaproteobacteria bacterium]